MIRLPLYLIGASLALVVIWHECGENLGVFCYRLGSSLFARARATELVPVRVRERLPFACSKPYETFSTRSTMWRA